VLIRPATSADAADIAALLDEAFGPARRTRTAALLRGGSLPLPASLVARGEDGTLAGSLQFFPVTLAAAGAAWPLTLLGPMAVARAARSQGLGRRLLAAALDRADAAGLDPIVLIGDLPYYGPAGFSAVETGDWHLPGPVERDRLLLRRRTAPPLPMVADLVPAERAARCVTRADPSPNLADA